jgi:hypothetical protein
LLIIHRNIFLSDRSIRAINQQTAKNDTILHHNDHPRAEMDKAVRIGPVFRGTQAAASLSATE